MRFCGAGHDLDVVGEYVYANYRSCKPCQREKSRQYGRSDRGKARRAGRAERSRPMARLRQMEREYGITPSAFEAMSARQGGACAICGAPERARSNVGGIRRLSIDHDHDSGNVRGLLCSACNRGLGLFADDLGRIEAARRYLQTWFPR